MKTTFLMRTLFAVFLSVALSATAQEHRFYRVAATTNTQITAFSQDRMMIWSNAAIAGTCTVQVAYDLPSTAWVSYIHTQAPVTSNTQSASCLTPAPVSRTGQTNSFESGDDGDLEPGVKWPDPRFTVQPDTNLVVDNLTGLMWARNAGLMVTNWEAAVDYCTNLNLGAFGGWHLPSINELVSLLSFGQASPCLPEGHPFSSVVSSPYWSSTWRDFSGYHWYVDLNGGAVLYTSDGNNYSVLPVRNHQSGCAQVPKTGQTGSQKAGDDGDLRPGMAWPIPRFNVCPDTNAVIDNLTGLVWSRNADLFESTNWSEAVAYCRNLELAGFSDWRMPTAREMYSLLSRGGMFPSLPAGHPFDNVINNYWTSTTTAADTGLVWTVEIGLGELHNWRSKTLPWSFPVWPVRGGE